MAQVSPGLPLGNAVYVLRGKGSPSDVSTLDAFVADFFATSTIAAGSLFLSTDGNAYIKQPSGAWKTAQLA